VPKIDMYVKFLKILYKTISGSKIKLEEMKGERSYVGT
jgi:hypothetical protein